jgi:hypothetical protein
VVLDGSTNTIQWIDRTAEPGVTYYYAVAHVGTENTVSVQTEELPARIEPAGGSDSVAPYLQIVGPKTQEWSVEPRIVLYYGDGGSGVDLSSLRVSINQPLGTGNPAGRLALRPTSRTSSCAGRRRLHLRSAVAKMPVLRVLATATLTATIADLAGNPTSRQLASLRSRRRLHARGCHRRRRDHGCSDRQFKGERNRLGWHHLPL